jgi:hypothetical protein
MKIDKLIRNGKVGYIYHPSYGGFSAEYNSPLRFNRYLIVFLEENEKLFKSNNKHYDEEYKKKIEDVIKEFFLNNIEIFKGHYESSYSINPRMLPPLEYLAVTWIPEGTIIEVEDYDGYESINHIANINDDDYVLI